MKREFLKILHENNNNNDQFGTGSLLLNPELHTLCHQFNQLIYAFNREQDIQKKAIIQEALKTIAKLIKANNIQPHQLAVQSTYIAVVTNQSTETIKEQLKLFVQPTILQCDVEDKNKLPEISTCLPQEDENPVYGCGTQSENPLEDIERNCLPDLLEPKVPVCGGITGIDIEDTVTSCGWSQGLPAIEEDFDTDNDKKEEVDEPAADDKEDSKESDGTPQQEKPKNKKQPRKGAKPWDLQNHDPAIDIEKIDFSLVPYLTEEEIELIKQCIKRFLEVEGFLANDGALWRILKFENQKNGSLFELEYIIKLSDQNKKIIKMGEEIDVPGGQIEIDIETDTELIECKSGVWEMKDKDKIKKLKEKLLSGKEYGNDLQKPFVVVSKQPIPLIWKNWFNDNNIKYRERHI